VFRDGKPAPDAAVTLQSSLSLAGATPERSVRTDAQGRFSLGVVPPARYTVIASAPDRIAASVEVDLGRPMADPSPGKLELHLGRCEATIMGVVRDASGGVVRDASIGTNRVGYFAVRTTRTDDQGRYRMCVVRGINTISIAAAGYGAIERVGPATRDWRRARAVHEDSRARDDLRRGTSGERGREAVVRDRADCGGRQVRDRSGRGRDRHSVRRRSQCRRGRACDLGRRRGALDRSSREPRRACDRRRVR
jgi:hypothetical protein